MLFIITLEWNSFSKTEINNPKTDLSQLSNEFNQLNKLILNGSIEKNIAKIKFKDLIKGIDSNYKQLYNYDTSQILIFPLEGVKNNFLGPKKLKGYFPKLYNYFDGNKHKGHPAYDLFINDRNGDCLLDKTNKKVNVHSITNGIVVACEDKWDENSKLRGGKYIWIYNPFIHKLTYYAHNSEILVKSGDLVIKGQVISTVGRTGYNAFKKRSSTHLHLMQLYIDSTYTPKPINLISLF